MEIKERIEKIECKQVNIINIESKHSEIHYTYEFIDSPGYGGVAIVHLN
jgi:GTP-binding protein EngB required for normal cell division